MQLQLGEPAPAFEVTDTEGKPQSLAQYAGQTVLLAFFRYAACPLCNLRVHELTQRAPLLKQKGLKILAFFESDSARVAKLIGKHKPPFPLVGDPQRIVYKQYGVESSWAGFVRGGLSPKIGLALANGFLPGKMENDLALLPADILIGPDGKVLATFYATDIAHHMPLATLEGLLSSVAVS